MEIDKDTLIELRDALNDTNLPIEYGKFARKWIAFNRAYNDAFEGQEWERVEAVGDALQEHWDDENIQHLASEIVRLECIGGKRLSDHWLLQPKVPVKAATLHLRSYFGDENAPNDCVFVACRDDKRELCNLVVFSNNSHPEMYTDREFAALLRLVYQVRCNLVHGEKRIGQEDMQTDRDEDLILLSTTILDRVMMLMLRMGGNNYVE